MTAAASPPATVSLSRDEPDALVVWLGGAWLLVNGVPSAGPIEDELARAPDLRHLRFRTADLADWDTAALMFVRRAIELGEARGLTVELDGLPQGVRRLLALAGAVPERAGARHEMAEQGLVERVGLAAIAATRSIEADLTFLGRIAQAVGRFSVGKARFRRADLWLLVQQSGVEALPVVSLVSFFLGVILSFVGAIQLQTFGATIYVANLVGIAMTRDMAALMSGIIMAGRSGASFAAQIGAMQANQETDALVTTGVSPVEFLVAPRVVALVLMMPLLTLYADAVGILGGAVVGRVMLDLSFEAYFRQTVDAISLSHVVGGVFKGAVYGVLVAFAGCLRGLQAGRSSLAVGDAATSAVVTGIVAILIACGVFAFVFFVLGL